MRLYGGRLLKKQTDRKISQNRELRDAIVFAINESDHSCNVKIQGSDQVIKAHYNENWGTTPQWLKLGNAVRVTTPWGGTGRIEVASNGFGLPTAITGGNVTPTLPTAPDAVLSGCKLRASGVGALGSRVALTASVTVGTFRIGGTVYALDVITMDVAAMVMDRPDIIMNETAAVVSFVNTSGLYFRIDIVVIDAAGAVTVVQGTGALSDPVKPPTPSDKALIGHVLINPSMAVVGGDYYGILLQKDVGKVWSASTPSVLSVTSTDWDLAVGVLYTDLTFSVLDQYGNVIAGTYFLTIVINFGNGTFASGVSSPLTFYGSVVVRYTRIVPESSSISPTLSFTESAIGLANAKNITLRDGAGDIMI